MINNLWKSFQELNILAQLGSGLLLILVTSLILLLVFRVTCLTFVDNYEFVYQFDSYTGEITYPDHKGYVYGNFITAPVHTIDLRPIQLCISGDLPVGKRMTTCKLVQFNPAGIKEFLDWHGRDSYDSTKLTPILMAYAFENDNTVYPFMTIKKELKNQESGK